MSRTFLPALCFPLLLSACVWVELQPAARAVRVAMPGEALDACLKAGEIAVSVKARVAAYHRNPLKVRDELETLARNEALGLSADTIRAVGEPIGGEQRFAAFRCGSAGQAAVGRSAEAARAPRAGEAETIPLRED